MLEKPDAVDVFELRLKCSLEFRSLSSYSSDRVRTREEDRECRGVGLGVGFGVLFGDVDLDELGEKWDVGGM